MIVIIWVAVHFLEHIFLEDHPGEALTESGERLPVLCMGVAIAMLLTMATAFQAGRRDARKSPLPRSCDISSCPAGSG